MTEREAFKGFYGLFRRLRYWDDRRSVQQFFQVRDSLEEFELIVKKSGMTESQMDRVTRNVITAAEGKTVPVREPSENSLRVQIRVYSQRRSSNV